MTFVIIILAKIHRSIFEISHNNSNCGFFKSRGRKVSIKKWGTKVANFWKMGNKMSQLRNKENKIVDLRKYGTKNAF